VEVRMRNGREYFRLDFVEQPASMQIIEVAGRKITTQPRAAAIIDASGGGLCIRVDEDLPVRRGIVAAFDFTFGPQHFVLKGIVLWKFDDRLVYQYGVKFLDLDEHQRGLLVSILGRIQIDRNAKTKR
jgi:c-di-GMP-binding flagellar brake protein YcgR